MPGSPGGEVLIFCLPKIEVPKKKRHPEFIRYIHVPHPTGYTACSANWLSCQFVVALRVP
jgi:hypothetical protein